MAKTSNKITANQIKKLEVGQSAYGSNLRATRNKSGITFHACFAIDGERYLQRLGTDDTINLTDAVREAGQFRAKKEREHQLKRDGGVESDMTLNEAVPMYFEYLQKHHGKNVVAKEQHFRLHILPALGSEKIRCVYTSHIKRFYSQLLDKGLSQGTVNRTLASLNDFYKHAKMERWVHSKPYEVKISNNKFQGRNSISADDQALMMAVARQSDQHPMIYLFMLIGFSVGMRHREILSIRWEHVNWEKGYVWLSQSKVGPRDQPLTEAIMAELRRLKEMRGVDRGYVFASEKSLNGRIPRMNDQFARVCKAAGLGTKLTPHFMRHTCVTELVGMGCNDRTVAHFTGHKTAAMISRYTHLDERSPGVVAVMKSRGAILAASEVT